VAGSGVGVGSGVNVGVDSGVGSGVAGVGSGVAGVADIGSDVGLDIGSDVGVGGVGMESNVVKATFSASVRDAQTFRRSPGPLEQASRRMTWISLAN